MELNTTISILKTEGAWSCQGVNKYKYGIDNVENGEHSQSPLKLNAIATYVFRRKSLFAIPTLTGYSHNGNLLDLSAISPLITEFLG